MADPKSTKFALVRPLKCSSTKMHFNTNSSHGEIYKDIKNTHKFKEQYMRDKANRKKDPSKESLCYREYNLPAAYKSSTNAPICSVMQTLDRKISASSDQLDTLKKLNNHERPQRTRSSSRLSCERNHHESEYKMLEPLSEYKNTKADPNSDLGRSSFHKSVKREGSRDRAKTPFEMFLEDDGPYSRKLYGPLLPNTGVSRQKSTERQTFQSLYDGVTERQTDNSERLVYTSNLSPLQNYEGDPNFSEGKDRSPRCVKKGLLWQQKDKMFSRWKERLFLLTQDYLHCFKKDSSAATERGPFLSKIKLSEVDSISLLTKKGYLTISLSHVKDGRVFLRRHEGIKEWYCMIKAYVYESKKRRLFWAGGDIGDHTSVEAGLVGLGRQNPPVTSRGGVDTPRSAKQIPQEYGYKVDRAGDDSGLESGHCSMNTGSDTQSEAGEESSQGGPASHKTRNTYRRSRLDSFRQSANQWKKSRA